MYQAHFGLREPPFNLTPDTGFFFASSSYQEALNTLLIAVSNGEGFLKVTGEVGTGKTLLCRKFLASLSSGAAPQIANRAGNQTHGVVYSDSRSKRFVTAYIPNPYLDPRSLLMALAEEFGVALEPNAEQHHLLKALTRALLDFARHGKRVVVCLDEAQAMPVESLEALRLLTNFETEKRKLLQVVLFGQPELEQKLAQRSVRQLKQRITFHYRLAGLRKHELAHYLAHRLKVAGYRGEPLFASSALRLLQRASSGTPRLVNILAHKALLLAYGEGRAQASRRHVEAAVADTPSVRGRLQLWRWLGWGMAMLSVGGVSWVMR